MPDPNPDESDDSSPDGSDDSSPDGYEVTVRKENGENLRIKVIDIEADDLKEAERKALDRDDVFEIVDGCTVGYETKENGGEGVLRCPRQSPTTTVILSPLSRQRPRSRDSASSETLPGRYGTRPSP